MKYKENHSKKTLNCRGKILTIDRPLVMGIINATPDSFYSESRISENMVVSTINQMLTEGADILEVGGYSSRPNGKHISVEEEIKRVVPVVKNIRKHDQNVLISLDTFRSEVLLACLEFGIDFVNDISGGKLDTGLPELAGKHTIPYIAMHMKGTPQTMISECNYANLLLEINSYFSERISSLKACGIHDIIIDPGFGFSKNLDQNFELLAQMSQLQIHRCTVLAGLSRKSMIYKTLDTTAENALNGTTALHMTALQNGAKILRVHDVKEAKETIQLYEKLSKFS